MNKGVHVLKTTQGLRSALFLGTATLAALTVAAAASAQSVETVTVTGTLIQGNTSLVSPVTVIDTTSIDQRGISTIQGAIQALAANNGPALTNSFTANGAFAGGASAVSLRGMSTNSTLVLFDGLRAAYYPLADDGSRNFVDLNTVPDAIVDSIEVLKDGASASYGADAIAGVVNIKTKKEFQGLSLRASGGIADRGDAGEWKFSGIVGWGDLAKDHVNSYIAIGYNHSDILYNRDRPYPFNSDDATGICYEGTCGADGTVNTGKNGSSFALSTAANFVVAPGTANSNGSFTPLAGSTYQLLNSNCGNGTAYSLTAAQLASTKATADKNGTPYMPSTVCQYDYAKNYYVIQPSTSRFSISGHTAFILPNGAEGYVEANFMQNNTAYTGSPAVMYGTAPAGIYYKPFATSTNAVSYATGSYVLYLPVYVCAARTNCDTATDRTLNPNNPYASSGYQARIFGRDMSSTTSTGFRNRAYRVAGGLKGNLFGDVKFDIGVTAMHTDLQRTYKGYVYIQHLLDVIADGSYNFIDPSQNTAAVNSYLKPTNITNAASDLAQVQATVSAPLYALPGGDLTLAVGTAIAYEGVNAPSANSDINGPTQRYFSINAFGTNGHRNTYAGFFEISAPIIEEFTLSASGRYDSYSSGQSNFSPKIGFWSRPYEGLVVKGSYSEGFRIPSFGEANSLPTTGYVSVTSNTYNDAYLATYGCSKATFSSCPTYIRSTSIGETTLATPDLEPEHSRSWVADVTYQLTDEVMLNVSYYNIKKTNAIISPSYGDAIEAYYAGTTIPSGFTVIADAADTNNPNNTPRISTIQAHYLNAAAVRTAGWDFGVTYDADLDFAENLLGFPLHVMSLAQATFIQNLDTKYADGTIERYDGTLGNYNLTAGSGTMKWKGNWQSTFTSGDVEFTSTLNWTSGYNLSAMDQGTGYRDCGMSNGNTPCRVADYFTWDVNTKYKLREDTTVYFTMQNVLDAMPPVDNVTYGAQNYNPVQGGDGILGRYLKLGVKFDY